MLFSYLKTVDHISIRGVMNIQGGEYDTYHEYKATNTTINSLIQNIAAKSQKFTNNNDSMVN